ncbi:unnamed protein product, partial [Brenthis ino]
MSSSLLKSEQDVRKWIITLKLSYGEVCEKFGIDINNDRRNAFFWNMMLDKKIIINEELLSWCGYYETSQDDSRSDDVTQQRQVSTRYEFTTITLNRRDL